MKVIHMLWSTNFFRMCFWACLKKCVRFTLCPTRFFLHCMPHHACNHMQSREVCRLSHLNSNFWGLFRRGSDNCRSSALFSSIRPGYYMYIETSLPRQVNDVAVLYSPFYRAPSPTCQMSFWYHMYGSTVGRLNVSAVAQTSTTVLWTRAGNQGNSWKSATISLGSIHSIFQVCVWACGMLLRRHHHYLLWRALLLF